MKTYGTERTLYLNVSTNGVKGYILRFVSDLLPRLLPRSAGHRLKVTSFNLYTSPWQHGSATPALLGSRPREQIWDKSFDV